MVSAGLLFAVVNIVIQSATMRLGEVPASVAFWQYLIALIFAVPWVLRRIGTALRTSQLPFHVLRVFFAAAGVQLWVWSLADVPIWQAIALIMTSPFFVVIGARLFLGEQVSHQRWLAVTVGFIGGMIILAPWSDAFTVAALLPVGAALLWALSSLVTKHLTRTEQPDSLTLYLLLLLAPINAVLAAGSGYAITTTTAIWLIAIAGVLTATAQYALAKAYAVADAAYLQPFDHLKLPFNVVLGWLAFGFLPDGNMWIGSALIIVSSFYLLNNEARLEARPARSPS